MSSWWPVALLTLPVAHALIADNATPATLTWAALAITTMAIAVYWLYRRRAGDPGRAVSLLIAAIALNDAVVASAAGQAGIALVCGGIFALALVLQRFVPAT